MRKARKKAGFWKELFGLGASKAQVPLEPVAPRSGAAGPLQKTIRNSLPPTQRP